MPATNNRNDRNDRNCYNCIHTKVCHMRIELAKQINRFKYLAATPEEVKNTNAELPATVLDTVVARTCTEFFSNQGNEK